MKITVEIPSPCFVLEQKALKANLSKIDYIQKQTDVKFILALKGFAMFSAFPVVRQVISGTTASSLFEAKLGHEEFGSEVHAYAPVYLDHEFTEMKSLCTHISFNSLNQYNHFKCKCNGISAGLRINPEYSEVETDLYNPCVPGSRLGIRANQLIKNGLPAGIEGLHSHNLCECMSTALENTLNNIEQLFGSLIPELKWLNLGGGHLVTHKDYDIEHLIQVLNNFRRRHPNLQIIMEPGSAVAWDTGVLVSTVIDIVDNCGIKTAILDTSFAAHMPDCLEMPYTPRVEGAEIVKPEDKNSWRLGGCSCLAGDFVGSYRFAQEPVIGSRIVFKDMMHYTMVKTNMFNGINLPSIGILDDSSSFRLVKNFTYEDYKNRLS
jgi:carboxynorspermidine decarboxylase